MRLGRLDGLRTVAVALVILMHHKYAPLGGVGVDLFFVLSGYLITGILRHSRGRSDYWGAFYLKRATRILPPVIPLILVTYFLTRNATVSSALTYLFFLGGFDVVSKNTMPAIANMWSLAVEEHFYLLWPFAIRFLSESRLKIILIAIIIAEPMFRLIALAYLPDPSNKIYFLTPFRLDGLAAGSLLALLTECSEWKVTIRRWAPWTATFAFALYGFLYLAFNSAFNPSASTRLFSGFSYSIITLGMVSLIAYVLLNSETPLSRVLALKPMVWLGSISYGLYLFGGIIQSVMAKLFHSPIYPIPMALEHKMFFFDVLALILLSWVSFRFYEHPIVLWGKQKADGNVRSETTPSNETAVTVVSL